jgi:hypothetical protein
VVPLVISRLGIGHFHDVARLRGGCGKGAKSANPFATQVTDATRQNQFKTGRMKLEALAIYLKATDRR